LYGTQPAILVSWWSTPEGAKKRALSTFTILRIKSDNRSTASHWRLEQGYAPANQIVGAILSGDPTYITIHNGARPIPAASTGQNILVKSSQPTRSGFPMDQVKKPGQGFK